MLRGRSRRTTCEAQKQVPAERGASRGGREEDHGTAHGCDRDGDRLGGGYFDGEKKSEVDAIAHQLSVVKRKLIDVVVHARTFEEFYEGR